MTMLVFDLETAPIDSEFTRELEPVRQPYPAWDDSTVKLGNAQSLEAVQRAKAAAKERWERDRKEHVLNHAKAVADWQDAKTLNPLLSRVLAIGSTIGQDKSRSVNILHAGREDGERDILEAFWDLSRDRDLAGWNIQRFDLPFLIERSQLLDVEVPEFASPIWKNSRVIDLMVEWNRGGDMRKLDHVAAALKLPRKIDLGETVRPDGLTRKTLPHEVSPTKLAEYLTRDVEIEAAIAHRLFPIRVLRPWEPEPDLAGVL